MEEDPPQLFDANHQIRHVAYQKACAKQVTSAEAFIVWLFSRLIHVFLLIICLSTLGMIYIVADQSGTDNETSQEMQTRVDMLQDFAKKFPMYYGAAHFGPGSTLSHLEQTMRERKAEKPKDRAPYLVIHPLYVHLQRKSPMHNYVGEYEIPTVQSGSISLMKFYHEFVSKSIPLVIRQDCVDWELKKQLDENQGPAQDTYLSEMFINKFSKTSQLPFSRQSPITYTMLTRKDDTNFKQGVGQGKNMTGTYQEFRQLSNKMNKDKYLHFIQNMDLNRFYQMRSGQMYNKNMLDKILRKRNILYTQWPNFARKARKVVYEQYICVVKGSEHFKLVSPLYRKNIYVGVFDGLKKYDTPLDFFNVDYTQYPLAQYVTFIDVELKEGDCVYVPAYYYIQSETLASESIVITQQYASHSQLVDLVFDALEDNVIGDQDENSYDKKIKEFLGGFY